MKKSTTLAAILLTGSLLTACGGSGGDYCKELKDSKEFISGLDMSDFTQLGDALDAYHGLAELAPSEIEKDWAELEEGITSIEDAFEAIGLKLDELKPGQVPPELSPEDQEQVRERLASLDPEAFAAAATNIEKHAKDECGVDLG